MDIKQIVNSKGVKGAVVVANGAAQDLHLLHSMSQVGMPMSDTGSERGNSPHDSEHSRYSAPRFGPPMNGVNVAPNGMRYPSPTAMQSPLPMLQQPYRPDSAFDNGMMQQENQRSQRPSADGPAQKAFPCSSCGKGFARRSDLARHGMS
jgi:hypothetical protein